MVTVKLLLTLALGWMCLTAARCIVAQTSSSADPLQLPGAMHTQMKENAHITVGPRTGDITGADNRALQAAVDYVAGLGGGTVEIGPGEYLMRDSLHLRSHVTVRGTPKQTVLRKARSSSSALHLDGDYGEEQITVENPTGFAVGDGVAIWDKNSGGFHTSVARIEGRSGNTFSISLPLNADCMVADGAQAATVFPVVSGYNVEGARLQDLTIDGEKQQNVNLNGCRGGGIFLYRCHGAVVERCTVRNYNGDGISFQQCNDVSVLACASEANAGLGIHPGSGSQRPVVRQCAARNNGEDGLFLCWRVKQGLFEENILEGNARFGISIGHKDTDNLLRHNQIRGNHEDGIFFRDETEGMAAHRNRLENNLIENNGLKREVAGIRVQGETQDLVFKNNIIRDTRATGERKQKVGISLEEKVGAITLEGNQVEATKEIEDKRKTSKSHADVKVILWFDTEEWPASVPARVFVGSESVAPADFLVALADAWSFYRHHGKPPVQDGVTLGRHTRLLPERHVAEDTPELFGEWVIHKAGFRAPKLMELARLQSWTLKPALTAQ